jgi:hypothetical protein
LYILHVAKLDVRNERNHPALVEIPPRSGQSPESLPPTPFTIARIGKGSVCREDDGNDEY